MSFCSTLCLIAVICFVLFVFFAHHCLGECAFFCFALFHVLDLCFILLSYGLFFICLLWLTLLCFAMLHFVCLSLLCRTFRSSAYCSFVCPTLSCFTFLFLYNYLFGLNLTCFVLLHRLLTLVHSYTHGTFYQRSQRIRSQSLPSSPIPPRNIRDVLGTTNWH